jgi:hypothetical protein
MDGLARLRQRGGCTNLGAQRRSKTGVDRLVRDSVFASCAGDMIRRPSCSPAGSRCWCVSAQSFRRETRAREMDKICSYLRYM